MEIKFSGDSCVTVWKDNKPVYVASNSYSNSPLSRSRRWNRVEKKYMEVPVPNNIAKYNSGMGGVDLLDAMTALYRGRIRLDIYFIT